MVAGRVHRARVPGRAGPEGVRGERRRSPACALPAGLVEADRLPEPIFTPTTKAPVGEHDEFITYDDVVARVGPDTAEALRRLTLEVYRTGRGDRRRQRHHHRRHEARVRTYAAGELVLADEVLTPDSSRFWSAADWSPGRTQYAFDKQLLRDWAAGTGWDRTPPGPEIPDDVVEATRARYIEAYQRITGATWGE